VHGVIFTSLRDYLISEHVQGTAGHYGQTAAFAERACMRRGDPSCTFEITLSGAPPA
jgi:hypothetical protein